MRDYEVVLLIQSDLDDTARAGIAERVSSWITDGGGVVVKKDDWGKRRLAYPIRKQREGHYVLLYAQMDPALVGALERNIRFLEPVFRYMIVNGD
ncbi:MAG TPA: 30S ribosomal protein S6 [Levilinea sp.]|nr:30S ribosomal protein S6 [Levilinea sp.]